MSDLWLIRKIAIPVAGTVIAPSIIYFYIIPSFFENHKTSVYFYAGIIFIFLYASFSAYGYFGSSGWGKVILSIGVGAINSIITGIIFLFISTNFRGS